MKSMKLALLAVAALAAGCRYDPVQQNVVDSLGPDTEPEDEFHRPGQPCLACHSTYEGARPFAVAGTVYQMDADCKKLVPAVGVQVTIVDSSGKQRPPLTTNKAGNFSSDIADVEWSDLRYPLSPSITYPIDSMHEQTLQMQSLVGRDGSCATCHKLPDPDSIDARTGAGRDSAGVIRAGGGCP